MSTVAVGQQLVHFKRMTPICGNCRHEQRECDQRTNRTRRSCAKHGWFVLMSATCDDHEYKEKGASHATSLR